DRAYPPPSTTLFRSTASLPIRPWAASVGALPTPTRRLTGFAPSRCRPITTAPHGSGLQRRGSRAPDDRATALGVAMLTFLRAQLALALNSPLRRNTFVLVRATALTQALLLLATPILTRLFSPEDFGAATLTMLVATFFAGVASMR